MNPKPAQSLFAFVMLLTSARGTPEDDVRSAAQRLLQQDRVAWTTFMGEYRPEQDHTVVERLLRGEEKARRSEKIILAQGRWEKTGLMVVEKLAIDLRFTGYRDSGGRNIVLSPNGWMNEEELMRAIDGARGNVKYIKFQGREFEQQEILARLRGLMKSITPNEELLPLLDHILGFESIEDCTYGEIDPTFAARLYLPNLASTNKNGHAYFKCWIARGILTRYVVDYSKMDVLVEKYPRIASNDVKTILFDTDNVPAVDPPFEALEKLAPN